MLKLQKQELQVFCLLIGSACAQSVHYLQTALRIQTVSKTRATIAIHFTFFKM